MRITKYMAGLTLVEAMMAIALIAIVAAYASPSFVAWQRRDRVEASARSMLSALAAARVEAITRGARVALCRGAAAPACGVGGAACAAAGAWSCGWSVVLTGESTRASTSGTVLRRMPSDPGVRVDGASPGVVFSPPGGLVIGGFRRFEISPLASRGPERDRCAFRCIRIAAGGRARMSVGPCEAA